MRHPQNQARVDFSATPAIFRAARRSPKIRAARLTFLIANTLLRCIIGSMDIYKAIPPILSIIGALFPVWDAGAALENDTRDREGAEMSDFACEGPIETHPDNPHYLCYKGAPVLLISSDQRFRAVVNRDFDYLAFFDKLVSKRMNFTRIYPGSYVWFDEIGNSPAPGRQLVPWQQTSATGAHELLGGFRYDLDRWDETYFARLKDFCEQAQARDIIVMITLFNGMHSEHWEMQPMNAMNNIQGVGDCPYGFVQSLDADPRLVEYQEKYIAELVRRLDEFDNVLYYLCSEPQMSAQPAAVYAPWLNRMIDVFRAAESPLPKKHLLGQSLDYEFYKGPGVTDFTEDPRIDFLTDRYIRGLGALDAKYPLNKPFVHHGSCNYADPGAQVTIPYAGDNLLAARVEAWEHLVGGAASYMQYNTLYTTEHPAGTDGIDTILDTLATLRDFMESFNFIAMKRDFSFIKDGIPADAHTAAMCQPGRQYAFYIHHAKRTGMRSYLAEPGRYRETLSFALPPGEYLLEWIQPADGKILHSENVHSDGDALERSTPVYSLDLALRIRSIEELRQ